MAEPDRERLRYLFDYHPDGYLVRRVKTGPTTHVGQEVRGTVRPDGYHTVWVDGAHRYLHRVVFAWHHDEWPKLVDHEDRDKSNNRVENLRELSAADSTHNTRLRSDNTSGFKGVYRNNNGGIVARPKRNGKRVWLGVYDTPEQAAQAIKEYDIGLAC